MEHSAYALDRCSPELSKAIGRMGGLAHDEEGPQDDHQLVHSLAPAVQLEFGITLSLSVPTGF